MKDRFESKTVIVTGAAGGVGLALVRQLTDEGARVVAVDIKSTTSDLLAAYGEHVIPVVGDVSRLETADAAVEVALKAGGRIDALINNAAVTVPKSILDVSEEEYDFVMNVNVKSMFFFCKKVIPHMIDQGGGAIATTASISGRVGLPSQSVYCASKGAMVLLTKQLAVEYAKDGIRVNAVGPGAIETPFLTEYFDAQPDPKATAKAVAAAHPMGRWAQPEEVAKALLFLCSNESSFTTGHVLMVDGGYVAG